jgi:hypothetical protein
MFTAALPRDGTGRKEPLRMGFARSPRWMGHDDHGHETLSFIEALNMCSSIASGDGPKGVLLRRLCCRRRDIRRSGG